MAAFDSIETPHGIYRYWHYAISGKEIELCTKIELRPADTIAVVQQWCSGHRTPPTAAEADAILAAYQADAIHRGEGLRPWGAHVRALAACARNEV